MGLNFNKLFSNRAINAIDSATGGFTGGITGTLKNLHGVNKRVANPISGPQGGNQFTMPAVQGQAVYRRDKMGLMDAIKEGHKAAGNEMSIGGYSAKKIAGTYIGVSAAGRIATGGGLYKDRNGETDIIGLPFI